MKKINRSLSIAVVLVLAIGVLAACTTATTPVPTAVPTAPQNELSTVEIPALAKAVIAEVAEELEFPTEYTFTSYVPDPNGTETIGTRDIDVLVEGKQLSFCLIQMAEEWSVVYVENSLHQYVWQYDNTDSVSDLYDWKTGEIATPAEFAEADFETIKAASEDWKDKKVWARGVISELDKSDSVTVTFVVTDVAGGKFAVSTMALSFSEYEAIADGNEVRILATVTGFNSAKDVCAVTARAVEFE